MNRKFDIRTLLLAVGVTAALGIGLPAYAAVPDTSAYPQTNGTVTGVSDTTITSQVESKLSSMSTLKDADISVSTSNGVVTLSGTANSSDEKSQAEAAAKSVKGVKSVDNQVSTSMSSSSSGGGK